MRRDRNPRDPRKWHWRPSLGQLTVTRPSVSGNSSRRCCSGRPMQCPLPRRVRDGGCAERMANGDNEAGDAMTAKGGTGHTTFTAFLLGLRSLAQHPGLAVALLLATLTQGALQGGVVWAVCRVLIILHGPGGVNPRVFSVGALGVCWV